MQRQRPVGAESNYQVVPEVGEPVLSVTGLSVEFDTAQGVLRAVDDVSFDVFPGETLAIVGESGCGKTMSALAILGLVPQPAGRVAAGRIDFGHVDLVSMSNRELRQIRGSAISMIFQEPVSSLNPVFSIAQQIAGVIRAHDSSVSRQAARGRAIELLLSVGVPDAAARADEYPHQWSGGMCQRAMIAMAIANRPRLLIADEPTTALDVTIQAQVLEVLEVAKRETGAATLLITHDLGVVAEMADRVAVMYAGRIVETGTVTDIFTAPRHPYTLGLLASLPRLDADVRRLVPIPGQPPQLHRIPTGCAFHTRCRLSRGRAVCTTTVPPLAAVDHGRRSACHFSDEMATEVQAVGAELGIDPTTAGHHRAALPATTVPEEPRPDDGRLILEVQDLRVHFPVRMGVRQRLRGAIRAVDGVSLRLMAGQTLGLVGESGCGKSTTALAIMRLLEPTSGRILFNGQNLARFGQRQLREVRRGIQMIFQDPHASLNPRMTVGSSIAEPLHIHHVGDRAAIHNRVVDLLEMVGLDQVHANRFPHQFSGGQLQRVGIARALALDPQVLVLDEPVSALDVSVQAQVISLLQDLQAELGLAYLFISHDLSVVRHICDQVAVMYLGHIIESGDRESTYSRPSHPYTQSLLSAVPRPDPTDAGASKRIVLAGDIPSSAAPPSGCRFRTRCWMAEDRCAREVPELFDRLGDGSLSACHFAETALRSSGAGPATR